MRIFDLDKSGGKKRRKALEKLADMKIRLKKIKKLGTLESIEAQKLLTDYFALSDKLDWRIENEKEKQG